MKPFFCYFGGKWRAATKYPKPIHSEIIESFAGAAGYSTRYPELKVTLYDADPAIAGLWKYLIKVKESEIRSLPVAVAHVDDLDVCEEAKWLIGFWLNKGAATPNKSPSAWARSGIRPNSYWGEVIRDRIATQVNEIRHWRVFNKDYTSSGSATATWFVDPPYQGAAGRNYRFKFDDYKSLGAWCRTRRGQVIVCEQAGADWLPFQTLATIKATPGKRGKSYSAEVMWTNDSEVSKQAA